MHVTACLAGQKVEVEVGEECRTLQALQEAVVEALPQLCVEGFDVSVGGRALDDDEGIVSLTEDACLDVSANARGFSVLALREAGRAVSEYGFLGALREGDSEFYELYLKAGMPPDCADENNYTPLHFACYAGNLEAVTLFLDWGAAIDAKIARGSTALHIACSNAYVACGDVYLRICALLIDRGCAINGKNDALDTPLHLAVSNSRLEASRLLLSRGCAVDEKNNAHDTPLHVACQNGHLEICTLLLDHSCAAQEKNIAQETPLHIACSRECYDICALLFDRGCKLEAREGALAGTSPYPPGMLEFLSARGHAVLRQADTTSTGRPATRPS